MPNSVIIYIAQFPYSIDLRITGITMEKHICNKLITNQSRDIIRLIIRAVTGVEANQISMKEYLFICNTTNGITTQLEYAYIFINYITFQK